MICFVWSINHSVQADVGVFQHYNIKNGLPDGAIKSIVQDKNGFIWLGSQKSIFRFDGLSFKRLPTDSIADFIDVIDLFVGHDNSIWIGSKNQGLLKYSDQKLERIIADGFEIESVFEIKADTANKLWVTADQGLFEVVTDQSTGKSKLMGFKGLVDKRLTALDLINDEVLVVGQTAGFYLVDVNDKKQTYFSIDESGQEVIYDLLVDSKNKLWIATSKRLLKFDLDSQRFLPTPQLNNASRILSITQHLDDLWVATIGGGLFRINAISHQVSQYNYLKQFEHALSEDHIRSVFVSDDNLLWVGGFSKGLSLLDLNLSNFNFESNVEGSYQCANNSQVYSIEVDEQSNIWLGLESGLVKYNQTKNMCQMIGLNEGDAEFKPHIYHTEINGDVMWVSGASGLIRHDLSTGVSYKLAAGLQKVVFFTHQISNEKLLVGTESGLYFYWINDNEYELIDVPSKEFLNRAFLKFAINSFGEIYLPTSKGLLYLDQMEGLKEYPLGNDFSDKSIAGIYINKKNDMFVSIEGGGLYHMSNHRLVKHYHDDALVSSSNTIYQLQHDELTNTLWLGTLEGLVLLDLVSGDTHLFNGYSDFNYFSQVRSSYQSDGIMYFAGSSGFVFFNPINVEMNSRQRKVIIDDLNVMNDGIGDHSSVFKKNYLNQIVKLSETKVFNHRDGLIVVEFITLDYGQTENISYAYKLEPVFSDWVELPIGDRQLAFTNLKSGSYQLAIRASDESQQWSDLTSYMEFEVKPAPWYTWWAFMCYLSFFFLASILYSRNKIRKEKSLNLYLNQQVEKQTAHIKKQKETVELLMAKRNEVFSNVTHEFRTPLTLIQGPISELKKNEKDQHNLNMLSLVLKNSKKLLRLVNQMLTVSEVNEKSNQTKEKTGVANNLKMIVEPYIYSAKNKGITLSFKRVDDVNIEVTSDCIDLVVGNLLSNSIKYTQAGGEISVATELHQDCIEIYVQDTGMGFDQDDVEHIFKRFSRLPQNQEVEGAGIGLALVKELVELNDGSIRVHSETGVGSRFSVFFPVTELCEDVNLLLDEGEFYEGVPGQIESGSHKDTVLIIEDNPDMRSYIKTVLAENFNCVVAENGSEGIALALKLVPDVVVCDVMMPGVDGFHVCRILRDEMVTSHIPLILLTALTEKTSRIKGWRENIDMYLNKPFDADELNLQIRNVLNVRAILKQNNHSKIELKNQIDLSTLDQKFMDKLNAAIAANYHELSFNLKVMAQEMFVSERQLQRKVKALVGFSPMDLLRTYRLKQAAKSLRGGHQISVTSDTCGFSSISYFSQAFKRQFGMTPRNYQQLNHEK